ncbi:C-terminal processing peptidase-3, Serine peptidase, MEROPS family S41A [Pelodictyon luteolum DSM 273]|uniref:C-terminal processing peptidase-3, Serine peptidase, MEROPS family S41A n=2 Tax=Pelodictyon luteolum TaxID=1100 RepID=Q3B6X5_CHLL3|nr:C-terminal processing peptidase-3, Serine peptidase, MEROPS family S41A [Pelodictyon luteolum DSM 273]
MGTAPFGSLKAVAFIAAGLFALGAAAPGAASTRDDRYFETARSIDLMGDVTRQVAESYVDTVDISRMLYSGIDGMLETLDPYSVFLDSEESRELGDLTSNQYAGIGVTIAALDGSIYVTSVEKGWPAETAGLRTGDRLTAINGVLLAGKSLDAVRELIRGNVGSPVTLRVQRHGTEPFTCRLVREEVRLSTVGHAAFLDGNGGIAYISLTSFADRSGVDLKSALGQLQREAVSRAIPMQGIILDLRENPGGLLDAAVDVTGSFVAKGSPVVSIRGRSAAASRSYATSGPPFDASLPLAVLINARSASAAEIVAGAVQDLDRGVIIGERSFGKGLVQSVIRLPYENALKLTTAKYYTPSGRLIQKEAGDAHGSRDVLPRKKAGEGSAEVFRTASNRKVFGGGGILPDIIATDPEPSPYLESLERKGLLFLHAALWRASHPQPPAPADSAALVQSFSGFLETQEFTYRSLADRKLEELKKLLAGEKTDAAKQAMAVYRTMEVEIAAGREREIGRASGEVYTALREEVLRHYDERLAAMEGLRHDPVVRKASEIIARSRTYRKLLSR